MRCILGRGGRLKKGRGRRRRLLLVLLEDEVWVRGFVGGLIVIPCTYRMFWLVGWMAQRFDISYSLSLPLRIDIHADFKAEVYC